MLEVEPTYTTTIEQRAILARFLIVSAQFSEVDMGYKDILDTYATIAASFCED